MAITNITKPATFGRINDSNRGVYKFSSTNSNSVNFQYQFNMKVYYPDNFGYPTDLGTFNIHPAADGTAEFNPFSIYANYISQDINLGSTVLTELKRSALKFQLFVYEFYGAPPTRKTAGSWYEDGSTNPLMYLYNGNQQAVPYDYTTLNYKGNLRFVMDSTVPKQGQFLTDATEFRMDNSDYGFLYALGGQATGRPTRIRYTIKYWAQPGIIQDSPTAFGTPWELQQQSLPTSGNRSYMPSGGTEFEYPEDRWVLSTATAYDTTVSFLYANSIGYYFPCGPANALPLTSYLSTWAYYDVDILATNTVLNTYPIRFIRTNVCTKYGDPWQLFWLNAHGGYDTFTFDRKRIIDYSIKRDTYKIKLPPTYSTYDAGERVFNTESIKTITLNTRLLTQQESQLLIGLAQSPVVYAIRKYVYGDVTTIYSEPFIVDTESIRYEQKSNDKEISMSISIRPANETIIQKN